MRNGACCASRHDSIEGAVIVRSASSGLKVAAGTVGTMGEIAAGGLFEAAMSDHVSPMTAAAAMAPAAVGYGRPNQASFGLSCAPCD